jgi:gamma-glutamyltranspeptidase
MNALFVTNLIDYAMSLEDAIAFPRFAWKGDETLIEKGYRRAGSSLRERLVESSRIGVAQGVELMSDSVKSVCDTRGEGLPAGD